MNWSMFITIALILAWNRWDKKNWSLYAYLRDILILFVIVYLYTICILYLTSTFHFTPMKYFNDYLPIWLSGIIFFSIICAISIVGWRKLNREKRKWELRRKN